MAVAPLYGLVLAGGRSERMGRDKAGLQFAGMTLLDRAVTVLRSEVSEVFVSVRADQDDVTRSRYPRIVDSPGVGGPAAGLLAAHGRHPEAAWLVVACDMPLLTAQMISALVAARRPDRFEAVAWQGEADRLVEPLCTLYEPATLAAFRRHVAAGGPSSPLAWLAGREVHVLERPAEGRLTGVNTPEQWQDVLAGAGAGGNNIRTKHG